MFIFNKHLLLIICKIQIINSYILVNPLPAMTCYILLSASLKSTKDLNKISLKYKHRHNFLFKRITYIGQGKSKKIMEAV